MNAGAFAGWSDGNSPKVPDISNFEMLRPIGGGSYGQVWLARDVLGEYRAVKVVRRSQFVDDRPYDREFEGIRRLQQLSKRHAALVDLFHAGRGDGFFYYVWE